MYEAIVELVVGSWEVLGVGVAASVLTVLGVLGELTGLQRVMVGNTLGYWFLFMGAVALYAAYTLTVDELLPRVRDAREARGTE